jgi:hypothetical protein
LFVTRRDVCQVILVVAPDDREMFRRRYQANLAFLNVQVADGGREASSRSATRWRSSSPRPNSSPSTTPSVHA